MNPAFRLRNLGVQRGDSRVRRQPLSSAASGRTFMISDIWMKRGTSLSIVSPREAMHEESIQFFTYLIQNDRPVTEVFDADYTFLNESLAKHYGIPGVIGPEWRRVDGGNSTVAVESWVKDNTGQESAHRHQSYPARQLISEKLLGERLPCPPKDVPRLPRTTVTQGQTVRQLVEKKE